MSAASFSAAWLAQREPFDVAAREAAAVVLGEADFVRALPRPGGVLRVLDLGAGTGANLRYLAPRIGGRQHWRVVDNDAGLLAAWPGAMSRWASALGGSMTGDADALQVDAPGFSVTVIRLACDLSQPLPVGVFADVGLITASALLDLMSAPSLHGLLERGAVARAAWWFALSVDGRFGWPAPDADDAFVAAAYARHQQGDKGFGPALGPHAPAFAAAWFEANGYAVRQAESDWRLEGAMAVAQIEGMARAASDAQADAAARIAAWRSRRLAAGGSMLVGHEELLAN